MRVLVTGGAGFLGINLIRYLLDYNYELVSLDIIEFEYEDVKDRIEIITGDIADYDFVLESMRNIEVVIHCAAALPLYPPERIVMTNYIGTKNVLEAAYEEGVQRVIHISSTAVYGIPDHHPIFEGDELMGVGPYGETKVYAEKLCEEFRDKGLIVTILRPKSFVGPERLGVFAILFDWVIKGKNVPIVGTGKNRYQLLDVSDLSEAIRLAMIEDKEKVNDVFNIGAKEFTTMAEDFGVVLAYAGYSKRIIGTPAKVLIFLLRILETMNLSPLYKWVYETAPEDSYVDVSKAEKQLGFTPKYSNKEALLRTYRWYEQNYEYYQTTTGVSHRQPWKQGILSLVKVFF